jgi:hypothetical protein
MGVNVPTGTDENGDPTGYVTLAEAFPVWSKAADQMAYYIEVLKSYIFSSKKAMCDPAYYVYAVTSRRSEQSKSVINMDSLSINTFDRFIWFCPRAFNPTTQAIPSYIHSAALLSSVVSSSEYPTGPGGNALDHYVPLSGTFYHELYHLVDSDQTTKDPYSTCFRSPFFIIRLP